MNSFETFFIYVFGIEKLMTVNSKYPNTQNVNYSSITTAFMSALSSFINGILANKEATLSFNCNQIVESNGGMVSI